MESREETLKKYANINPFPPQKRPDFRTRRAQGGTEMRQSWEENFEEVKRIGIQQVMARATEDPLRQWLLRQRREYRRLKANEARANHGRTC